ncbi:MAG: hypothetical protein ACI86S_002607 [Paracoccaceae bacterium]
MRLRCAKTSSAGHSTGGSAIVFGRQHLAKGAQGIDNYKSALGQLHQMRKVLIA